MCSFHLNRAPQTHLKLLDSLLCASYTDCAAACVLASPRVHERRRGEVTYTHPWAPLHAPGDLITPNSVDTTLVFVRCSSNCIMCRDFCRSMCWLQADPHGEGAFMQWLILTGSAMVLFILRGNAYDGTNLANPINCCGGGADSTYIDGIGPRVLLSFAIWHIVWCSGSSNGLPYKQRM